MQRFKQPNMDLHPDGEWIRYDDHVEAMKRIAGAPVANALTAKQRYDEFMEPGEEPSAVERLRFFCSLAMSGQDWLDVEPFFDAILAAPPEQAAASPAAQWEDHRVQKVYEILCRDDAPPPGEHWEGFQARLIVDAICGASPAPSASAQQAEPYNAYQRDWDKVVRWVKFQSETFPELANMSPEGAISWLVVELAARHEKFAEPSAAPAALTYAARRLMLAADDVDLGRSIHNERKSDDKIEGPVWGELRNASAAVRALLAASPADQVEGARDARAKYHEACADAARDARDAARYRIARRHVSVQQFCSSSGLPMPDLFDRRGDVDVVIDELCDSAIRLAAAMSATPPAAEE